MRRLAIRSVLSAKAADGSLRVVKELALDAPSAKQMVAALRALGFERSVLVVTGEPDANARLSARNIDSVNMLPAAYLNVVDLLGAQGLLMTVDAVRGAESLWGGERSTRRIMKAEA
jgi:large subunit ribosomal protein L4